MRGGGEEGVERRRERLPHTHGTRWPGKQPPPPPGSRALSPPLGTGGSDGRSGCRARRPRRARCCGVSGGDGERPGEPPKGCDGRRAMAPGCRALPEPRPRRAGAEPSPGRRRGEEGGGAPCSGPSSAGSGLQSPVSARAALLLIVLCPWEEKQNVLGAGRGRGPPSLPPSRPPPPHPRPSPRGRPRGPRLFSPSPSGPRGDLGAGVPRREPRYDASSPPPLGLRSAPHPPRAGRPRAGEPWIGATAGGGPGAAAGGRGAAGLHRSVQRRAALRLRCSGKNSGGADRGTAVVMCLAPKLPSV